MTDRAKDAFAAYLAILVAAGEITEDQGIRICQIIKEADERK